jgi:hypothetical protein
MIVRINCGTQAECDGALARNGIPILLGDGNFLVLGNSYVVARESSHVVARESSHVVARESSRVVARESSRVEAWGSSRVVAWGSSRVEARGSSRVEARGSSRVEARGSSRVEAWGSSRVVARGSSHVVARGSSHVVARGSSHVVAWGSSHVVARGSSHVEAWGSSHVVARGSSHVVAQGSSHVVASKLVAIHQHSDQARIDGGVVIRVKRPKTPLEWCEFYGARIEDGHAILFKGVNVNFESPHGIKYAPGTMPTARDWDGGKAECGGGLHFSPHPIATLEYNVNAERFIACPVKLEDIFIHPNPEMPNKVKAKGVSLPCYETDRWGKKVPA